MSGGHFDYQEYHLDDFADSIEREIAAATAPRPEKVPVQYVNVYRLNGPGDESRVYVRHPEFPSVEAAVAWLEKCECCKLGKTGDNLYSAPGGVYEIVARTYMGYPDGGEYTEWNETTLKHMRDAVDTLRRASVYVHRIDWLLCGDDGEDSFDERLREELGNLGKPGAD